MCYIVLGPRASQRTFHDKAVCKDSSRINELRRPDCRIHPPTGLAFPKGSLRSIAVRQYTIHRNSAGKLNLRQQQDARRVPRA